MKRLSERQVRTCEESARPRCKCRCRGALHGIQRGGMRQEQLFKVPQEQQHRPQEQAA